MRFIKVKNIHGNILIINLDNVFYFYGLESGKTDIYLSNQEDFIRVEIHIDEFERIINLHDKCVVIDEKGKG